MIKLLLCIYTISSCYPVQGFHGSLNCRILKTFLDSFSFPTPRLSSNIVVNHFVPFMSATPTGDLPSPNESNKFIKLTLSNNYDIETFLTELNSYQESQFIAGVYALETADSKAYYIGSSTNIVKEVETIYSYYKPLSIIHNIRIQTFSVYNAIAVEAYKNELIRITNPPANQLIAHSISNIQTPTIKQQSPQLNDKQPVLSAIEMKLAGLKRAVAGSTANSNNPRQTSSMSSSTTNKVIEFQQATPSPPSASSSVQQNQVISPFEAGTKPSPEAIAAQTAAASSGSSGQQIVKLATCETTKDFTIENIDLVLNEVRPYLIADGGNVAIVSIDKVTRGIKLLLQGACGSCASSTTTMKMGIERVLKENFVNLGPVTAVSVDELKQEQLAKSGVEITSNTNINGELKKVEDLIENLQTSTTIAINTLTIEKVSESLSNIQKAITGLGGKIEIQSVNENNNIGQVKLRFKGPNRLKKGIELVLKDVPAVTSVIMEDFVE